MTGNIFMDINLFSPFSMIERPMPRRPLNHELDPNQLQSSQTPSFPYPRRQKIMLPMKRNDQLGVFSFRQTSFINLHSDDFLPRRVAELALVYSMGRSMMLVSGQNRS